MIAQETLLNFLGFFLTHQHYVNIHITHSAYLAYLLPLEISEEHSAQGQKLQRRQCCSLRKHPANAGHFPLLHTVFVTSVCSENFRFSQLVIKSGRAHCGWCHPWAGNPGLGSE